MERYRFYNHTVTPEGLIIRGFHRGVWCEILVPRDDAELFKWIDPPLPEEQEEQEQLAPETC